MDRFSDLRIIGPLTGDPVARQFAAHDPHGEPVLLTVGADPLDPGVRGRFADWAERLTVCSRHPHIAGVFAHGLNDDRAYLAVRTGRRRTLAEALAAWGPLRPDHVQSLGIALCDALATAHRAGLRHLAVRPEVIFVDEEERPLLAGFDAAAPGLWRPMATGPLSAPEYRTPRGRLDGEAPAADAPGDVYGLAATLYLALGGSLPWGDGTDPALRHRPLPDLAGVPPGILDALRRGTAVHPVHRPSAERLRDALLSPQPDARGGAAVPGDGSTEAGASLPGVVAPVASPRPGTDAPGPEGDPAPASAVPPGKVEPTGHGIEPLVGAWRVATDAGDQELLVVDPQGGVTWTGNDEAGPFLASGEAVPLSEGGFRLLLNEPAGSLGFFVDLRLSQGGLEFLMDQAPDDGMVDVPAE